MQDFCSGDSGALRRIKERRRKDGHKKRGQAGPGDGELQGRRGPGREPGHTACGGHVRQGPHLQSCEIGWHIHEGDGETFLILSGEGEFNDNGTVTTVRAGDVCFTGDGEGHSLKNLRDEPLEYVALVLYH